MSNKLPKYSDDEVKVFHPILEDALKAALSELKVEEKFDVIHHHKDAGSIIPDFAVQNRNNGKIILFLEVKRTRGDVSSTRYRQQAKSYVEEAGNNVEKPYYVLTNLEVIDFFKHHSNRRSVLQQLLEPSPIEIGSFSDNSYKSFFDNLVTELVKLLDVVLTDSAQYKNNTIELFEKLKTKFNDRDYWHNLLLTSSYEYIRGAFSHSHTLRNKIKKWAVATYYKPNIDKVSRLGLSLNFKDIFELDNELKTEKDFWSSEILQDIFTAGQIRRTGEDIANIIHEIVQEEKKPEGFVSTDPELARLLLAISKKGLAKEISDKDIIFDPGAGIGNLLSAVQYEFDNIEPKQIWANEIEEASKEALSLILGLTYCNRIAPDNSPKITINDISEVKDDELKQVKLVVMNPPYISGVNSKDRKVEFSKKIEKLTGKKSILDIGQIGFEALFFEFVYHLVPEGTLISAIIPKRYWTAQGKEAVAFRRFLLEFGDLRYVAFYPKEGIFEEVIKSTMIVVFEKGSLSDTPVNFIEIRTAIEQIDFTKFLSESGTYGVNSNAISKENLKSLVEVGWSSTFGIHKDFLDWADGKFTGFKTIEEEHINMIRGRVGNQGASNLCFIDSNKKTWSSLKDLVTEKYLQPAVRNSDRLSGPIIDEDETEVRFFDISLIEETDSNLNKIIETYLENSLLNEGKQKKNVKTKEDLLSILKRESTNCTNQYTILVPRNIRRMGSLGLSNCKKLFVSTNFVELTIGSEEEAKLLLSWLLSIYGQLQFEHLCNDQEGARKIEKEHIKKIKIPDFTEIEEKDKENLLKNIEKSEFLDLYKIKKRNIDELWTDILEKLTGKQDIYEEALDILENFVQERRLNS